MPTEGLEQSSPFQLTKICIGNKKYRDGLVRGFARLDPGTATAIFGDVLDFFCTVVSSNHQCLFFVCISRSSRTKQAEHS